MINKGRHSILGVNINAVDYESAVDQIICAAREKRPFAVSALAVHGVMTGVQDPEHLYRLNHLDLVVPDGQPVRWALQWLYRIRLPDRVYGPTLTLKVCEEAAKLGLSIYLYGSKKEVLLKFQDNLKSSQTGLKIAGSEPSRFRQLSQKEMNETAERIKASGADVVFVGLGCPRQEVWAYEYRDLIEMPMLAVGAAFDFHAGTLPQAPKWMQQRGMEWLFRLAKEPMRLWRRYVILNPLYCLFILAQKFRGNERYSKTVQHYPSELCRYG